MYEKLINKILLMDSTFNRLSRSAHFKSIITELVERYLARTEMTKRTRQLMFLKSCLFR
jgi:hypothetical protein